MVTKLADRRGQIAIKGHEVTDEWETLVRFACKRNGQSLASFIVECTRDRAQAIMKNQPESDEAIPAGLPVRLEDVVTSLSDKIDAAAERQDTRLAEAQAQLRQELARHTRKARWRR